MNKDGGGGGGGGDATGKSIDAKADCSRGPTFSTPEQLKAWINTKANLFMDLLNYWPSIRTDFPDDSFWKHEWNNHGVCSSSHICSNTYFEKGVEQSKKLVNLLAELAKSGIVPSDTKLYTAAEIKSAVQKVIKTNNVYVSCLSINNVINLREIYICLDKTAGNYVSCPASQETRGCGNPKPQGTIKFPPFPPAFPSYDIIQMVISWPPTYCQSGITCKAWNQIKKKFSLHGLWPADATGKSVAGKEYCSQGPTFSNPAQLTAWLDTKENLVKDLSDYWPSIIKDSKDESVWTQQWNEHGVCSSSHICTNTYFEKAVDQSKKLDNLLEMLKKSGIEPHATKLYPVAKIKSAVQEATGKTNNVYISCYNIGQDSMLREISICLDKIAGNYVPCPAGQEPKSCKGPIKFPPFPITEQGQPGLIEDLGFTELAVDNIPMLL
ncbi:hypothetical protein Acr_16g0004170 [Actinidia rufa]|uniref:Uncharacterized protein n=1 Tax=Actinidia rufa TaxID=165716 RepID=A0A7J0FYN0_9ERIC|nr:hypothetical protein Acr_16g0004170 [Actinidia rufa]